MGYWERNLNEAYEVILFGYPAIALIILTVHFWRPRWRDAVYGYFVLFLMLAAVVFIFVLLSQREKVPLVHLLLLSLTYGAFLFVLICESLLWGLANRLTLWRGEQWPKELDYFYIGIAALGVLLSVNRLEVISDKFIIPDVYAPVVLVTAIVLRIIKTRAEVGGWNKPGFTDTPRD